MPSQAKQELAHAWLTSSYLAAFPLETAWRDVPILLCHSASATNIQRVRIQACGPVVRVQRVHGGVLVGTRGYLWYGACTLDRRVKARQRGAVP